MSSSQPPQPVVLKFGGTSVRDADAMRRVVSIVASERGGAPVVVTSACSGVTDSLLACAKLSGESRLDEALAIVSELRRHHHEVRANICAGDTQCESMLSAMLDEIERLVQGVIMLGELTPRTTDLFASFGERLSSVILAAAFRGAGWRAALADCRRFIITDECFTDAKPIMREIDRRAPVDLMPLLENNEVIVAQGFIGSTREGITTTIGRGGSDHTAALIGAALGAREIQIWTDVSGILTADPRLVPAARVVPEVTFTEARELAYFGAKVIHPDTILPAVERDIPVVIKNSMRPEDPGTRILPDGSPIPAGIHSITIKRGMSILSLSPRDPREGPAPVARALALFAENETPLHCAFLAETRALATVESSCFNDVLMTALESTCRVEISHGMALLCLTGAALRQTPAALGEPLAALDGIPVSFVGAGSSEHILLVAVPESRAPEALAAVHARLFEGSAVPAGSL
jgi:aspartate kinase